ncbi:unnamed protein product [Onchocerca flexuosa]|uniref:TAXi_C domain-containing protein n=1 Tax=Onchocerca flexuosa TaxID=387005 RepID=A0A183HWV5_9BILA|nr:unnamed protein product [Onchocerca flexuosa]
MILVTMEDGRVARERRSSKGDFVYIDEDDESGTGSGDDKNEVQEYEITFKSNLNGSQNTYSEAANHISLSNKQLKKRLYRQNLGYVLDLKPDLQMANVANGIYLGIHNIQNIYRLLIQSLIKIDII